MLPLIAAALPWFYPGPGPETVEIRDGRVGGMPVERTGRVLARVDDPGAFPDAVVLPGDGHVLLLRPPPGQDEVAWSRVLHARPDVAWAHPDLVLDLVPTALPDDPFAEDQWHLTNTGQSGWTPGVDVDAEVAWALATGSGAIVAVVDTGVDTDHPDLDVVSGYDYIDGDDDPNPDTSYDGYPHGTAAAGLAAARGDNGLGVAGVAYDAQVHAARLIGGGAGLSEMYSAFVEAVDAGAWVLSNSWGFGDDCPEVPLYSALEDGINYAEVNGRGGLGAAVVVSAGNGGCDNSSDGFLGHPPVIGVAAINGDDVRESYSSYGTPVDVAAPSGGVLTTDVAGADGYGSWDDDPDYYGYFSGTSASAPIVSGVLALMFEANPRLRAADARLVLCETAVRTEVEDAGYDENGWSPYYGCGRVDAGAAVLAVANGEPLAPESLGPAEAVASHVVLSWSPAWDPDGDWLDYEVYWRLNADGYLHRQAVDGTRLDLTGQVEAGDTVTWWVTPADLWGSGQRSAEASLLVVEPRTATPRQVVPPGCAASPAWGGGGLVLVLLFGRRRRVPRDSGRRG